MKGTPDEIPAAYASASPIALLPTSVPAVVAIGTKDVNVPPPMVRAYCEAARAAGCPVDHLEIDGADHFAVANSTHAAWHRIYQAMCARLAVH
jgi:acetyl esterase/lipase